MAPRNPYRLTVAIPHVPCSLERAENVARFLREQLRPLDVRVVSDHGRENEWFAWVAGSEQGGTHLLVDHNEFPSASGYAGRPLKAVWFQG